MPGDWRDIGWMRKAEVGRLLGLRKCLGRLRGDDDVGLSRKAMSSVKRNPTVDGSRARAGEEIYT